MNDRPTLKDVAGLAGVSEMTASRALRGVPDVSQKTRDRIKHASDQLGYVPNRIAGALASNTVNLVGVVVPSLNSFVFPEMLSGISSALAGSLLQPVVGISNYRFEDEENVIREMLSWRPTGLIIAGLEHSEKTVKMLKASGVPIVEVMDVDGVPLDYCVGISHIEAGRRAAQEILSHGYKNIGFVGTKMPFDFRARKRLRGFADCLGEQGVTLKAQEMYEGTSSVAKGRELTAAILQEDPSIDCIYYSSDVMSIGGLMHCIDTGMTVPDDVALVGFNGLEMLDGMPVQLATTNSFRFEIGHKAASIVLSTTADQKVPEKKIHIFGAEVHPGASI